MTQQRQLIGAAELIQLLGVSRKRAYDLSRRADFPAPVAELVMGAIWELPDVQAWADSTGRTLHPLAGATPTD